MKKAEKTPGLIGSTVRKFTRSSALLFLSILALSLTLDMSARADTPIDQVIPFKRPPLSKLQDSPRKACAVWHVWRLSVDNKPAEVDRYAVQELSPLGHDGEFYSVGGTMRQRPLPRPPLTDTAWKIRDMETEIRRASDIGLDCFFLSTCNLEDGGVCWDALKDLLVAIRNLGTNFKIVPLMDIAAFNNRNRTVGEVAKALASIFKDTSLNKGLMRDDRGFFYITATNGDKVTPAWWQALKNNLKDRGIRVSLIPTLQAYQRSKDDYLSVADGLGNMGPGTPPNAKGTAERSKELHALGKVYIAGIKPQDFRPDKLWYTEASNFDLFRKSFTDAISGNADWLMFNSWNDRAEATEFAPSTGIQWAYYDLAAYYITWFKMRAAPPITREVLYYAHRPMWTGTPYNKAKQPKPIVPASWESEQPPVNQIELLAFLKNPGELQIRIDGKIYKKAAGAGITSFRAPLAAGYPKFRLMRDGVAKISVDSPFRIRNTTTWQDFLYRAGSSTRPVVNLVANPAVTN